MNVPYTNPRSAARRWTIAIAASALLVAALVLLVWRIPVSSEALRAKVIATLANRLKADVELGGLTLRVFPRFQARGENLTVRHKGRRDVPPLFTVKTFTVHADVLGLLRKHVARVTLEGLEIQIPPRDTDDSRERPSVGSHVIEGRQVVVDVLEAPGAKLVILRRRKDKPPKIWDLHELRVQSVSANTRMPFKAMLTNAVPPGQIETEGSFGPWHRDDPGHTALDGQFRFTNADLSVFDGIAGILSARGTYAGSLERIEVKGETDTPDFVVNVSGHKVPLKTKYHAIVDGTNGDTRLERVEASFLNTALVAKGGVFDVDGVKGRLITLDVTMPQGRLEDVLRLAVKTPQPPMSGALQLTTKFELPPGDRDVVDKLRLSGRFAISGGRFADAGVQGQVNALSRRASGKADSAAPQRIGSDFAGRFVLADGVLALPKLTFDVPGAIVDLTGHYALKSETLAFRGDLTMDAKLSQTVTGVKSLLLKAVDPLFRKEGRTVIPVRITGRRNEPSFGLDSKRVFRRGESD